MPLSRAGPGLLVRDLLTADDPQILAAIAEIDAIRPDILVLTDFDFDHNLIALASFNTQFERPFEALYASQPNTGWPTGLDIDQNGRLGDARDAQGYGTFPGDGGMAVLSRFPIGTVTDLSHLIWAEQAWSEPPDNMVGGSMQRLSTTAHWIVPIETPNLTLNLLAWSATPPVFDGPEDRNGRRNADELRLWTHVLHGDYGPPPTAPVLIGNANLDPNAGEGLRGAMAAVLADTRLTDPQPRSDQHGSATAEWPDGPGSMRVSYILPGSEIAVADSGVHWPAQWHAGLGPHRMVWVDISP